MVNRRNRDEEQHDEEVSDGGGETGSAEASDDEEQPEEEDDPMAHLPHYVIKRVECLKNLNKDRDCIMEEYIAERAQLEKKFAALFQPLYEERAQIIKGDKDEEIAALPDEEGAEEKAEEDAAENGDQEKVKGIPQFWVCAMTNNDTIGEMIAEDDVDCLENLTDIRCVDNDDGKGFTLYFHFTENNYFENEVLTKKYEVPNLFLSDEPLLKDVKGTKIKWKSGHALTYRMVKKKQRGKGKNAGQVRTVTKKEELESFFRWFEPPEMPPMDSIDDEEAERLEEIFDEDYEVANAFRTGIIPYAALWFTGEADDDQIFGALQEDGVAESIEEGDEDAAQD